MKPLRQPCKQRTQYGGHLITDLRLGKALRSTSCGVAVQSCSKSQQALTSQLLDLITNHRLSADSEHSSDMWCRCSAAASLVGWYVSSQLRSALSPELTVTSHRGSLGESPTEVTILILKVARNTARMGKTLIQGVQFANNCI